MYDKTLIKDEIGQHYTIQTYVSPQIRGSLSPKEFPDHHLARQFVQRLQVPTGYWQGLMNDVGNIGSPMLSEADMVCAVCERIVTGQLKIFEVNPPNASSDSPKKRAIQTSDKVYHFVPSVEQLLNKAETKNFKSVEDAKTFLQELNPDEEQLKGMASELNVAVPPTASANPAELSHAIAESMAAGDTVVQVDTISSATPATAEEVATAVAAEKAGLGPEEEKKTEEKEEEKPCTLHKYTVECSHGRSVELDPAKQKEGVVPRLELVSVSSNADKDKQEKITVNLELDDPCDSHAKEQIKINNDIATYVGDTHGKSVEIRTPSEPLNVKEQHFRYVWLPSVKPVKYKVNPSMGFCHTDKFDGKGKGVPVYVYPEMKWEWKTSINFGKLEFVPGKAEFKYSDFSIGDDSNVVLTYDGEEIDAKEKYKEYIEKPMEGFKKVCDVITAVLKVINDPASLMRLGTKTTKAPPKKGEDNKDGNESKLEISWPNLSVEYDSSLKENSDPGFVDHKYSISIKSSPLLDLDIQVDIIETLKNFAKIPKVAKKIIEIAIEKIQKQLGEKTDSEFKGELDLIFSAKCKINLTEGALEGAHNVKEHDLSGKPLKTEIDIPVKLDGKATAKGRVLIISFDINYGIRGDAGWKGWVEAGKRQKRGIYIMQSMEFTGIIVTLTKYEEVKVELKNNKLKASAMFGGDAAGEKDEKAEKYEQKWEWLVPEKDSQKESPKKYYLLES